MEPSPYLPTTRRFANPLYLRVELIPEYAYLPAAGRAQVEALRADLATRLDGVDAIDRDSAWQAKQAALRLVYAVPRSPGRELAYQAYRQREGAGLDDYATWCALAREHGADWSDWPEPLRHPGSPAVAAFRAEHADEVDFHRWLQWVLDEQLAGAGHDAAAQTTRVWEGVPHLTGEQIDPPLAMGRPVRARQHARGDPTWRPAPGATCTAGSAESSKRRVRACRRHPAGYRPAASSRDGRRLFRQHREPFRLAGLLQLGTVRPGVADATG